MSEQGGKTAEGAGDTLESWLEAMIAIARHYNLPVSIEHIRNIMSWDDARSGEGRLSVMARHLGLGFRLETGEKAESAVRLGVALPLIARWDDGRVGCIMANDGDGHLAVRFSGEGDLETPTASDWLADHVVEIAYLRPLRAIPDGRVDDYIRPYRSDWFRRLALADWRRYGDVILASLFINTLALSSTLFSMQIYDRVVPAQSQPTLWVLFLGVIMAVFFGLILKVARTRLLDIIGKKADLRISEHVFGHAIRLMYDARPKVAGSFIAQLRELEHVRELLTATSIAMITDLPFFCLFLAILWMVGGNLIWVALAAIPLLVIPGILVQYPLARLSQQGMRESALRNALLIEAVDGFEDIKLMRAEPRFERRWNHVHSVAASIAMQQRFFTGMIVTWSQEIQTVVYALILLVGCFQVMKGTMTTGALVGCSILTSRMIAPLAQLAGFFLRFQQARVAREGLDSLMNRPADRADQVQLLQAPVIRGQYQFEEVRFLHDLERGRPDIDVAKLAIQPGDKIALLGKNGAGKSTLLRMLAGLHQPVTGRITLDGLALAAIDPSDLRRDIGLLTQEAKIFYGSLRDNLTMGAPLATDNQIMCALDQVGLKGILDQRADGLDMLLREGGGELSRGQRQSIILARLILSEPSIVLLDEPTAHFDDMTEHRLLTGLETWIKTRTLVVATHRQAVLRWVNRIIILDNGHIVVDGERDAVLKRLRHG
ncbi:type I secretion system permease/ATPase [Zymomonas mobilis]|uniref:Type I secretion system ATPase n=1 Tax=Zymomonas mobilis subsp. pomaceae (strain ATCC 29192 / DSM 22645 / JCM 10191 / CCUG 17912 / NBRC 13757 / NCIMB 11200 / NRRL B-4491 / Barker I) TaxID=579138 RepID=F8ESP2_ZYMMT|nr:type I secretion system permease/ATPase [Zymomonas mobilis]AEI37817.1 type I secretion system ATPase [Zymomonas mobilis subsp. pomaceae ATCC 29192]MDX5949184.1 type I secretion system permease/ATPase [Zymomonas mobilis subsp. pomaceae]GEB89820.1 ABC transporter ATP-binding protein [Zymomonas mobilis subsp. pomaceae]